MKKMRYSILTGLLLAIGLHVNAQHAPGWQWAKMSTGPGATKAWVTKADANGNIYIAGTYVNATSFDNKQLTGSSGNNMFVVKYTATGNVEWAVSVSGDFTETWMDLAVDAEGSVYVAGSFMGPANFATGTQPNAISVADGFLVKYSATGTEEWVRTVSGTDIDQTFAVTVDGAGNIYTTGDFGDNFNTTPPFGTALFSSTIGGKMLTSTGSGDIYIAQYNKNGDLNWVVQDGGKQDETPVDIACDASGNLFITGIFSNTTTLGGNTFTALGWNDVFIAKYNSSGHFEWAHSVGSTDSDIPSSIAVDKEGNASIVGSYTNPSFQAGNITLANNGGDDIYLISYDSKGDMRWAKSAGYISSEYVGDMVIDNAGSIFLSGFFADKCIFDKDTLISHGGEDMFIAKYSKEGKEQWVTNAGGSGGENGWGIALDKENNIVLSGQFNSSTFYFGNETLNNPGNGTCIFVAKMNAAATGIKKDIAPVQRNLFYPNPTTGILYNHTSIPGYLQATVYDITGRQVYSAPASNVLNLAHLNDGTYTLYLTGTAGTITQKIVIEH